MTPELFTLAPHSDPDTSRQAAKQIVQHIEFLESRVLDALVLQRHACAFELEKSLGLRGDTVRPRLVSLVAKGLIRKTNMTRMTPRGRHAAIYEPVLEKMPQGAEWP